ncbi:MAG: hypothetical protein AB8H80_16035 [Planctomycetota bacterium]
MIGVGWGGSIVALDSYTGAWSFVGSGASGQNAMAVDEQGTIWSTRRNGTVYELTTINPVTGNATVVHPSVDTRGLTWAGPGELYGAEQGGDTLVRIDTVTGASTTIGNIGFSGIQSLAQLAGSLYAWDIGQGLVRVDAATGAGSLVGPPIVNAPNLQWLSRRSDGRLVGGDSNNLYVIDTATGTPTLIGPTQSLRGAEPYQRFFGNFGTGCSGAAGVVASSASITAGASPQLVLQSTNHQANAAGIVVVGLTGADWAGVPLPLPLDSVFGTSGCTLYVRPDVTFVATTSASSPATLDYSLPVDPAWNGYAFLFQHATLENVQGGLSLSDASVVQFGW